MDTHLSDDMVKLVRYSIVSVQRDHETTLVSGHERIFDDNLDEAAFSAWVISDYAGQSTLPKQDNKYLRVNYEVLDRWPRQDRNYQKQQLEQLRGISEAIAQKSYFDIVARRLDRNVDRLQFLRNGFQRHAGPLATDVAGVLEKYREGGHFEAMEVETKALEKAFAAGSDAPFDPAGLESFPGKWQGVNRRFAFDGGDEMDPDPPTWHMTWGKGETSGDEYVQTVVGSQLRHFTADKLPPIAENKVDLALNVYRPEIGITGWLTTRIEFRQELALIAYELSRGAFLWIGQVLGPDLKPVMQENVFWMFLEWYKSRPRKSYYMYGVMFEIDFEQGSAKAFGDSFRKSHFSFVR